MAIGGLDIGSTGAKITVMEKDGRTLHAGYRDYPVARNAVAHEVNAADIWKVVRQLLRDAAAAVPELTAVGVISFGESFVLLDGEGKVLFPSMIYSDPRGEKEADILREKLGDDRICKVAGTASYPMYSLPKLMWIKENRPEIFAAAKYVCLIEDYLVFMLTGRRLIDYSLAARTMGFDIEAKQWSREIFAAAGIDPAMFSEPVPTGTDAGCIRADVAAELGLSDQLRVAVCCHDQVAAAVGSDVMRPGMATDGAGTVQCITPVFSPIPENRSLQDNHYAVIPFLRDHTYCSYAFSFTGGSLIKWFTDHFAAHSKWEAEKEGISVYRYLELQMKDEPTGILVLPHFAGAGTPYMDTGSKGVFVGMDLTNTPADIFRAIMEGITYEMRLNIEKLAEAGIHIQALNATGGCAKSKLWLQMKADILGVPVTRMSVDEAGTIGGIMLTGVATGLYANLEEAAKALVRPVEVYKPRREMHGRYEKHYMRYRGLYASVRPLVGQDQD